MRPRFRQTAVQFLAVAAALLLSLAAQASSKYLPKGEKGGRTETPLGAFSTYDLKRVCSAPNIVIGKVQSVSSFHQTGSTKDRPYILSHTTLQTETNLRGSAPSSLHLVLTGGKVDSIVQAPNTGMMIPSVGLRYFLAFLPATKAWGHVKKGDPAVMAFAYLDPNGELDVESAKSKWKTFSKEYCK